MDNIDRSTAFRPDIPQYLIDKQRHYRDTGITPGNPTWYNRYWSMVAVKPFKPDLSQRLPRLGMTAMSNDAHRAWLFQRAFQPCKNKPSPFKTDNPKQYIKAWDKLNHFKPCRIEWVKVRSFA